MWGSPVVGAVGRRGGAPGQALGQQARCLECACTRVVCTSPASSHAGRGADCGQNGKGKVNAEAGKQGAASLPLLPEGPGPRKGHLPGSPACRTAAGGKGTKLGAHPQPGLQGPRWQAQSRATSGPRLPRAGATVQPLPGSHGLTPSIPSAVGISSPGTCKAPAPTPVTQATHALDGEGGRPGPHWSQHHQPIQPVPRPLPLLPASFSCAAFWVTGR